MEMREKDIINERYEIIEKIDDNVFRCDDLQLKRRSKEYKCNNIFFKLNKSNELVETVFLNQINKIKDIKHKNILRVIDGEFVEILGGIKSKEKNLMFIVQEYFVGESLDKYLLANILNLEDRLSIVKQLIDGILQLHSLNIAHGNLDIKNIYVLRENGEITLKIGNYGLNKLNETFYDKKIISKKKYLNYRDFNNEIDIKNDIYALSLIVTEILGNYKLFLGEDINKVIEDKLDSRYVDLLKNMIEVEDENKGYIVKNFKNIIVNKTSIPEKNKKSYLLGIRVSPTILYEQNYISNYYDAKNFIKKELRESYITYQKVRDDKFNKSFIIICGKQVKFLCKVDKENPNMLVAIGLAKGIEEIEAIKEYALKVDWEWDIDEIKENNEQLNTLYERLDDNIAKYSKIIDIMKNWKAVLKVERENMYESRKKVSYNSFRYNKNNDELFVNVGDDLEDNPYTGKDDEVLVMTSKKESKRNIKVGKFEEYVNGEIIISVNRDFNEKLISSSGHLQIDTSGLNSLIRRKDSALRAIEKERSINKNLKNIIERPNVATSYNRVTLDSIAFKDKQLDESKKSNIIKSINSEDIFVLQGPPGTGKTTFISELVYQILSRQKDAKILISSQSHVAVDNALDKIAESIPHVSIIRLGENSNIAETMKEKTLDNHATSWINDISHKSILALQNLKENSIINGEIKNKISIIEKIDELNEEIDNIKEMLPIKYTKLQNIVNLYEGLNEFKNKIDELSKDLAFKKDSYSDKSLINKLDEFKKDYLSLGNMFISKFEEANSVSEDKDNLEKNIFYLENEIKNKKRIVKENKLKLDIKNKDDYKIIKEEIEKYKEEYEKHENICNILHEWHRRISNGPLEIESESIKHASIIGATCIEVGKKAYDLKFDWVIVDEAGRATPPEVFVPITLGKKILLVGDDKQLPPVIEKELYTKEELSDMGLTKEDLEKSLFAYLGEYLPDTCKGMLDKQYRMNPVIGDLISEVFYKGKLHSGCKFDSKYHGLNIDEFKNKAIIWLTTRNLKDKKETEVSKGIYHNNCELRVIKDYLEKINTDFAKQNIKGKSVGVICGYRKQKEVLMDNIESSDYSNISLDINTVDAFQGRECDIVFYSVVRSNEKGNIGFLKDIRRLNVALSRAKQLLVIVGDDACAVLNKNIYGQRNPFVSVIDYMKNSEKCAIREV